MILLPPANTHRGWKSNHRPHSFFLPAQLRKSKHSSESPPSPSHRQERAALLSPYLYSSVSPPRAGTSAKQRTSSPTAASSALLTWLCAASLSAPLPGSARGCRLKINIWLLWNWVVLYVVAEGVRGKGFGMEDGKNRAKRGYRPFPTILSAWGCFVLLSCPAK